jgi:esterase/lipase superfamily enzyme
MGAGEQIANPTKVAFVSLRDVEKDNQGRSFYGQGRGGTSTGVCTVGPDGSDEGRVIAVEQRPATDLLEQIAGADGRVVIYVHGFNISFEKGCRRAAMLQRQLRLDGQLLLFSWPADGMVTSYVRDLADLEWSLLPLQAALTLLAERFGHHNVDMIGHSMGAKALIGALYGAGRETDKRFGQMILVAPDVDSGLFVRDYHDLDDVVSRITIYVSENDRALRLSRRLNGHTRLGEPGNHTALLNGVDIVDVSALERKKTSGHLYHVYDQIVIDDIRRVLAGDHPPSPRSLAPMLLDD